MLLPAEVLKLPAAETARRLDAVFALLPELTDLAPRRAAGLSGGQGKMVALGRALMVGTRAVLLDEPFQGLAPVLAQRYAEALKRLHEALPDVAILITESNPGIAAAAGRGEFRDRARGNSRRLEHVQADRTGQHEGRALEAFDS